MLVVALAVCHRAFAKCMILFVNLGLRRLSNERAGETNRVVWMLGHGIDGTNSGAPFIDLRYIAMLR